MKVLFLTPRMPYPPHKGDQAVAYHRLRTLGRRHEITLLTFTEGPEPVEAEAALAPYCERIIRIPHPKVQVAWNLLSRGWWSRVPLQVLYYRSPAYKKALAELLATGEFEVVHAFMVRLLPYIENLPMPVVLEGIDCMRLNLQRQTAVARGLMRWVYLEELRRMEPYEPGMDEHIKRAVFVTPFDAASSGSSKAIALPLGVTLSEVAATCAGQRIAFSGNMGYAPNIQAVTWFVTKCWPGILAKCPDARFRIIGGNPAAAVRALASTNGVEVVGAVPDMAAELLQAALAVAPMQSGSGMQFKILEAMACGLPVVTNLLGLGSIGVTSGQGVVVAEDPNDMVHAVVELLGDQEARKKMGAMGRQFVGDNHNWDDAADAIESEWQACLNMA